MLREFIAVNRAEIIGRCRAMAAAARSGAPPTAVEIDHGVPMFLDQLVDELCFEVPTSPEIGRTATKHAHDLIRQGCSISQVVYEYGNVCQAIAEMGVERRERFGAEEFRVLNRCIDEAIAGGVTQFGHEHDACIDAETAADVERLGGLARELRSSVRTSCGALATIYSGSVGVSGSTGTVLDRSLSHAHVLIDQLLGAVDSLGRSAEPVPARKSA
jgi:hypothetical protein